MDENDEADALAGLYAAAAYLMQRGYEAGLKAEPPDPDVSLWHIVRDELTKQTTTPDNS